MRGRTLLLISMLFAFALCNSAAFAEDGTGGTQMTPNTDGTGGSEYGAESDGPPRVYVEGRVAKRLKSGYAAAPTDAPVAVQEAIFAANDIVGRPYVYGGGHGSFK